MRVVLDTNVIISAFLWAGKTSKILDLIKDKKITTYTCFDQIVELNNVLRRPKLRTVFKKIGLSPEAVIIEFLNSVKAVKPIKTIDVIKDDPFDNVILSAALAANAQFLITGDKHLLSLGVFQKTEILQPTEFLKKF